MQRAKANPSKELRKAFLIPEKALVLERGLVLEGSLWEPLRHHGGSEQEHQGGIEHETT